MPRKFSILRGGASRSLRVSLAGARAGGVFALDSALAKFGARDAKADARLDREAKRFARRLGELKGSYVKIGQLLALLGEHYLPDPLTRALHDLEAQTPPIPWPAMRPIFEEGLGGRYRDLKIDREPLAAASLAQVHRARVVETGQSVVVKGQYPQLAAVLDDDFEAVVRMLRLARWIPVSHDFDRWLSTVHEQLLAEVDYPRERNMALTFEEATTGCELLAESPINLRIPRFLDPYCGEQVVTMDYMAGYRVGSAAVTELPQSVRDELGKQMLRLFFVEIFDIGLMQTDPNFGNYLIHPDGSALALLDFGSVVELEDPARKALCDTIVAGLRHDDAELEAALVRLGCLSEGAGEDARRTFTGFIKTLLEPLQEPEALPREYLNARGAYCWEQSQLIRRAGRLVAEAINSRQFAMPNGDFAILARKLTGVFTFIAVLRAEFNGHEIAERFLSGPPR